MHKQKNTTYNMKKINKIFTLSATLCMLFMSGCKHKSGLTPDMTVVEIQENAIDKETFIARSFDDDKIQYDYKQDNIIASVFFDFDRAEVKTADIVDLEKTAEILKTKKNGQILIVGNCDHFGNVEYNLKLGKRRAQAVKDILTQNGVDGQRIELASKGSSEADISADKISGWKDRHSDIILK